MKSPGARYIKAIEVGAVNWLQGYQLSYIRVLARYGKLTPKKVDVTCIQSRKLMHIRLKTEAKSHAAYR